MIMILAKKTGTKSKVGKAGPIVEKLSATVEKDTNKLVNFVCGSNIYVEGEDIKVNLIHPSHIFIVKANRVAFVLKISYLINDLIQLFQLKPESEYPDWLWNIHIGPPKKLEELDPNSKEYWRRVRKMALRQNNRLQEIKRRHLY